MVLGDWAAGAFVCRTAESAVILLDTHAMIWLATGQRRAAPLERLPRLYLSPVSVLEAQFLIDAGKLTLAGGRSADLVVNDSRWRLDEPPAARWFIAACESSWTRDPFDRLLAAHARVRGWKVATADRHLIERLPASDVLEL